MSAVEAAAGDGGVLEKLESSIWKHLDKVPDWNGNKMVECRYCPKQYVCSNSSIGNL